jgi:hypothetical protein
MIYISIDGNDRGPLLPLQMDKPAYRSVAAILILGKHYSPVMLG